MTGLELDLRSNFRGCVGQDGQPSKSYTPEIMIERVWVFTDDETDALYANQNYVSAISVDPRKFKDVDGVFDAIFESIRGDLRGLRRDFQDENYPVEIPFQSVRTLIYNLWISNDNRDPQEQLRICVTQIQDPGSCIKSGTSNSFVIPPENKEDMMTLIRLCALWFDKSNSPQQELFPA